MALGSTAFPGVPGLPSTEKEMNTCYHLPLTMNYHIPWLFGGIGPHVSPYAPTL